MKGTDGVCEQRGLLSPLYCYDGLLICGKKEQTPRAMRLRDARCGGVFMRIVTNRKLSDFGHIEFIQIFTVDANRFSFDSLYFKATFQIQAFCGFILTNNR